MVRTKRPRSPRPPETPVTIATRHRQFVDSYVLFRRMFHLRSDLQTRSCYVNVFGMRAPSPWFSLSSVSRSPALWFVRCFAIVSSPAWRCPARVLSTGLRSRCWSLFHLPSRPCFANRCLGERARAMVGHATWVLIANCSVPANPHTHTLLHSQSYTHTLRQRQTQVDRDRDTGRGRQTHPGCGSHLGIATGTVSRTEAERLLHGQRMAVRHRNKPAEQEQLRSIPCKCDSSALAMRSFLTRAHRLRLSPSPCL